MNGDLDATKVVPVKKVARMIALLINLGVGRFNFNQYTFVLKRVFRLM